MSNPLTSDATVAGFRVTKDGDQYVSSSLCNPTTGATNSFRPDNRLFVAGDPGTCFYDGFDAAAIDTTNRWTSGGTAPTVSNGILTISPSTTALAASSLTSQPIFQLLGNMFVNALGIWTVDAAAKTGNYRFFGLGAPTGSPTVAAPITNGCGFEYIDTTGALSYVYWASGTRTAVTGITNSATAAVKATLGNGAAHRYAVYYKTSVVYWEIDGVVMATASEPALATSSLQVFSLSVNGAATVTPAAVSTFSFIGVGDTASNGTQLNDGQYPWRKSNISFDGALSVTTGGNQTTTIAAAGSANVKATPGRLGRVLITTAGTAAITFYDNAAGNSSGKIIGITPAVTVQGQIYDFSMPAAAGISAVGGAGSPAVTVGWY